jgi:hypothetical protein
MLAAGSMIVLGLACLAAVIYGPTNTLNVLTAGSIGILVIACISALRRSGRETSGLWPDQHRGRQHTRPESLTATAQLQAYATPIVRGNEEKRMERLAMITILNEVVPEKVWQSRLEQLMRDPEFRAIAAVHRLQDPNAVVAVD